MKSFKHTTFQLPASWRSMVSTRRPFGDRADTSATMSLKFFILLTPLFFLLTPFSFAQAHVLQSDGAIGAVLHTDPDDSPIANQPTNFFLSFKDKTGKFQPQNCNCQATLLENGKQIYSQALFQDGSTPTLDTYFSYKFPQKDVYQLKVTGQPTTSQAFQPFTLTYDIRVARDAGPAAASPSIFQSRHFGHYVGVGIVVVFFIGALIQQYLFPSKKNAERRKEKEE